MIKKYFLNNFSKADKIYKLSKKFPKFLKEIFLDLYFFFQFSINFFPNRLTIFLTDKCNMKCAHCFIINEVPKKTLELEFEDYKKIFKSLNGKTSQILFTGGEPTLRKDFEKILISSNLDGKIFTASIFSNALYPQKLVELITNTLEKTNLKINLHTSIDGQEKEHDNNRRVPGSFKNVIETIQRLNDLKFKYKDRIGRIVVNITITKKNMFIDKNLIEKLLKLNCFLGFGFVRAQNKVFKIDERYINSDMSVEKIKEDGSEKFGENYLNYKDMEKVLEYLNNEIWKDNSNLIYAFQKASMTGRKNLEKNKISPINVECKMGYDDMVILPNGKIARCEMLSPYINLKDYDFDLGKLIKSNVHQNYLKKTSGCFCEHECAISVTAMSDKKLLKQML